MLESILWVICFNSLKWNFQFNIEWNHIFHALEDKQWDIFDYELYFFLLLKLKTAENSFVYANIRHELKNVDAYVLFLIHIPFCIAWLTVPCFIMRVLTLLILQKKNVILVIKLFLSLCLVLITFPSFVISLN